MNSTQCRRLCCSLLALTLIFLLRTPALAVSTSKINESITVRQWAAMLCKAYSDTSAESGCVAEAYRRGWLPVTAVTAHTVKNTQGLCTMSMTIVIKTTQQLDKLLKDLQKRPDVIEVFRVAR